MKSCGKFAQIFLPLLENLNCSEWQQSVTWRLHHSCCSENSENTLYRFARFLPLAPTRKYSVKLRKSFSSLIKSSSLDSTYLSLFLYLDCRKHRRLTEIICILSNWIWLWKSIFYLFKIFFIINSYYNKFLEKPNDQVVMEKLLNYMRIDKIIKGSLM